MALGHQHRLWYLTRPQPSTWPSVVTEVMDINTDPDCWRDTDPDMVPGSSLGPDVIILVQMASRPPKSAYFSPVLKNCLLPQHANHSIIFLPHFSHIYLFIIMAPTWCLHPAQSMRNQAAPWMSFTHLSRRISGRPTISHS